MGKITYTRGTTYTITHTYEKNGVPSAAGSKLYLTVKSAEFDDTADDSSALLQIPVTMSGAVNTITITPSSFPTTVDPSDAYFYSIKVIETGGAEYIVDSGTFILKASTTNKVS